MLARVPELPEELADALVRTVRALRAMELKKSPVHRRVASTGRTRCSRSASTPSTRRPSAARSASCSSTPATRRAPSSQLKLVMSLLDRTVEFTGALRDAGVPVSTAETVDAMRALRHDRPASTASSCGPRSRRPRASGRSTADLRHALRPVVPAADRRRRRDGEMAPRARRTARRPLDPRRSASCAKQMRDELRDLLLDGDEDAIRRFARDAVDDASAGPSRRPGRQSYFAYRVLRALSPETLIASLLAAMLGDQERGGLAERVARQTIADRIKAFEEAVEAEVRRRLAEEQGRRDGHPHRREAARPTRSTSCAPPATTSIELRRQVYPLARRLATRLTARRRLGRSGPARLPAYGAGLARHRRRAARDQAPAAQAAQARAGRALRRRGSVSSSFAHFTLMLTHALREQFSKVRAFAFIDTVRRGHRLPARRPTSAT